MCDCDKTIGLVCDAHLKYDEQTLGLAAVFVVRGEITIEEFIDLIFRLEAIRHPEHLRS